MRQPTLLLVHGAWYGTWAWSTVADGLRAQGFGLRTVALSTCESADGDLHEDVARVRRALEEIDGPVVVCGHSYGGVPVSEAISGVPNVVAAIFVCAFVLPANTSLLDMLAGQPPQWWVYSLDGRTLLPDDPHGIFFADCAPDVAEDAVRRIVPFAAVATTQKLRHAGYTEVPSGYLVCEQDVRLPADVQRAMAAPLDRTWSMDTGHSPFLAKPAEFVDVLATAVWELTAAPVVPGAAS